MSTLKIPACVPSWSSHEFLANGGLFDPEFGFYLDPVEATADWAWEYLPDRYKFEGKPVLIPQMLPSNTWKDNLRLQLSKTHWDRVRRYCYQAAGFRCEICGVKGNPYLECHEEWVFYPKVQIQYLNRLRGLCMLCHKAHHLGFSKSRGLLEPVLAHVKEVNGWDDAQIQKSVEQAKKWANDLEKIPWTLDLKILERKGLLHLLN